MSKRLTIYDARILPNKELLIEMRANGASYNSLANVCGCSVNTLLSALEKHADFKLQMERAYQANLQRVRESLMQLATGAQTKTISIQEDADGNVLGRSKQLKTLAPDINAIKAVLTQAGEIMDAPIVNIDQRVSSENAQRLIETFNLTPKPKIDIIENKWKIN